MAAETVSFTLKPGEAREVAEAVVTALDSAVIRVATGPLMHLVDPRRLQRFEAGGPPVWSVAAAPVGGETLFLTYGLSAAVDASREPARYELSIRVPTTGDRSTMWAPMLCRALARYIWTSGRELKVDDYFPLPEPITRFPFGEEDKPAQPATLQDAVMLLADPDLGTIDTPRGPVEVRRVVGLHPDERALVETWSVGGLVRLMRERGPVGVTDPSRPSHAADPTFRAAALEGSRTEGSVYSFIAAPGVSWEQTSAGFTVRFPGGAAARQLAAMVQARLPFGKHLLVHDVDPHNPLAVALQPGEPDLGVDGSVLILRLPVDHPYVRSFGEARGSEPLVWTIDVG